MPAKTAREIKRMITPEIKRAAKTVFVAMAYTQTIRPVVEGYQRRILAYHQWPMSKEWSNRSVKGDTEIILDPAHTYLMEDEDFEMYMLYTRLEQAKAGLKTDSPEFCPLLVAEEIERKAKQALVDLMEPITGISAERVLCSTHGVENFNKLVDLNLRLLAPMVKTTEED